ncbi:3699_t:CDS:1, partial [Racocetra persica]
ILKGPKQGAIMTVQCLEQSIEDLKNEIQEENNDEKLKFN